MVWWQRVNRPDGLLTTAEAPVTTSILIMLVFREPDANDRSPIWVDQPDAVHLLIETDSPDSFAPNGFEDGVASTVTDAPGTGSCRFMTTDDGVSTCSKVHGC